MKPLVSVMMPSYQHGTYLAEAMSSVLEQTMPELELIVVDDASTDDSASTIRQIASRDPRVKPIFHECQCGIASTFNDALAAASGPFVAVLASDDLWRPNKLEKQIEVLRQNDELIIWCEGDMVDSAGQPTGKLAVHDHINSGVQTTKNGAIVGEILRGGLIFFAGLLAKTESIREFGFDTDFKYLNDIKLSVELARKHQYHFVSDVLCSYRWHGENVCKLKDVEGWQQDGVLFREYFLREFGGLYPPGSAQHNWVFSITTNLIAREHFLREFDHRLPKVSHQRNVAYEFVRRGAHEANGAELLARTTRDTDQILRLLHDLTFQESLLRRFEKSPDEVLSGYRLGPESSKILTLQDRQWSKLLWQAHSTHSVLLRGAAASFMSSIRARTP